MLRRVSSIRWEECASEKDALLRENHLLREPARLVRRIPPPRYSVPISRAGSPSHSLFRSLRQFLGGRSRALIPELTLRLLENHAIPAFMYMVIQEDLETLLRFYESGPRRNVALRKFLAECPIAPEAPKGKEWIIPQQSIDDLIVLNRYGKTGPKTA